MNDLPAEASAKAGANRGWVTGSATYEKKRTSKHASDALPTYAFTPVELPLNSPGLVLLRRLRDEAHRFAITFHRKIRDKRMTGSALEEVPGIGPRRKRVLLRMFGSVEGIRRASVEDLSAVPTMTKRLAEQVKEYLSQG